MPSGCELFEEKIFRGLKDHNNSKEVSFEKLRCFECLENEKNSDPKEFSVLSYQDRVKHWLNLDQK